MFHLMIQCDNALLYTVLCVYMHLSSFVSLEMSCNMFYIMYSGFLVVHGSVVLAYQQNN